MQLKGTVALITGGAQGIGRTFAETLLGQGVKVVICDINVKGGEETVKELGKQFGATQVYFMPLDVTNGQQYEECIKKTVEKMGGLDILMNNAGVCDERDGGWERMVLINYNGVVRGTKLGMKYMSKVNGGRGGIIINTASITSETPFPTIPIYAATKAAVSHFSRSFGDPLYSGKSGVKVIAINPGLTDTQILKNIADYSLYDPDVKVAFDVMRTKVPTQKVNNMGVGLLQVLEKAESGSVWTIENDQPAKRCLNPA